MCNGLSVISLIIQAERAAITKNLQGEVITLFRPVRCRAIQINACLQRHSLSKLAPVARSYLQLRNVRFRKAVPTKKKPRRVTSGRTCGEGRCDLFENTSMTCDKDERLKSYIL